MEKQSFFILANENAGEQKLCYLDFILMGNTIQGVLSRFGPLRPLRFFIL